MFTQFFGDSGEVSEGSKHILVDLNYVFVQRMSFLHWNLTKLEIIWQPVIEAGVL